MTQQRNTVLVSHPSPDLYGSDLQLLETVTGFVDAGWRVVVTIPQEGPLLPLLAERGAEIMVVPFPVLRKALLHPRRILGFLHDTVSATLGARRLLRSIRPQVVWVNTLTIPVWQMAAQLSRIPNVVHVHEAEEDGSRIVRTALVSPIALARIGVVNSKAAARAITGVLPPLKNKLELVYNGVPGPEGETTPRPAQDGPTHIALVGRLSPRKERTLL